MTTWRGGMLALTVAVSALLGAAAPTAAQEACPLASEELVSAALGVAASVMSDYGISVSGPSIECLFEGDAGLVLVARRAGYFGSGGAEAFTPDQLNLLRRTREPVDYAPVDGVGDAAAWATIRDPALAAERQPVLVVKQGADAYMFSVDDSMLTDALASAKTLALAVLAGQAG